MLAAIEDTAGRTTRKIVAIRDWADATATRIRAERPKIYSRDLVDVIFEQSYCRITNLVDKGIAKRQTASRYLIELAELGVVRAFTVGKEKIFINPRLLELLKNDEAAPALTAASPAGVRSSRSSRDSSPSS